MNNHDKGNLQFLLSLRTEQEWENWYNAVGEDDHAYAMEILRAARTETTMQLLELQDEAANEDLSLAKSVLRRYTLKTKGPRNGYFKKEHRR